MLQCVPLADSCLALGQASCRRARELAQKYAAEGVSSSIEAPTTRSCCVTHLGRCSCAFMIGSGSVHKELMLCVMPMLWSRQARGCWAHGARHLCSDRLHFHARAGRERSTGRRCRQTNGQAGQRRFSQANGAEVRERQFAIHVAARQQVCQRCSSEHDSSKLLRCCAPCMPSRLMQLRVHAATGMLVGRMRV